MTSSTGERRRFGDLVSWIPLAVFFITGTNAAFSVYPPNPVTQQGRPTVLTCLNNGNQVAWTAQSLDSNQACEIVNSNKFTGLPNCPQQTRYTPGYTGYDRNRNRNQAQLTIMNTQLDDAGIYSCIYPNDPSQRGQASVTVLAEAPSGEYSPKHVISGDNVTYTCRVSYNSSNFVKMSWIDTGTGRRVTPSDGGVRIGSRLLATGDHGHSTLIRQESTLTVTVSPNVLTLDPFMCIVYSNAPADENQPRTEQDTHTWNSSALIISYCPKNLAIRSTTYPLRVGSQLTCQADAYPPSVYRWMSNGGGGTVSGENGGVLTVTSLIDDVIEFRCMAMNFLGGIQNENPCYASTSVTHRKNNDEDQTESVGVGVDNRPTTTVVVSRASRPPTVPNDESPNSSTRSTRSILHLTSATMRNVAVHPTIVSSLFPLTAGPIWRVEPSAAQSHRSDASSMNNDHRETENSKHYQGLLIMMSLMMACVFLAVGVASVIVIRKHVRHNHSNQQIMSTRYIADRQELESTMSMTTEMSLANE